MRKDPSWTSFERHGIRDVGGKASESQAYHHDLRPQHVSSSLTWSRDIGPDLALGVLWSLTLDRSSDSIGFRITRVMSLMLTF